ncbi:MAG: hypothetical protein HQM14_22090 [SAR324 cluster bacterium]|nr:hypothetical protein [SAR324 cluster bacterium]
MCSILKKAKRSLFVFILLIGLAFTVQAEKDKKSHLGPTVEKCKTKKSGEKECKTERLHGEKAIEYIYQELLKQIENIKQNELKAEAVSGAVSANSDSVDAANALIATNRAAIDAATSLANANQSSINTNGNAININAAVISDLSNLATDHESISNGHTQQLIDLKLQIVDLNTELARQGAESITDSLPVGTIIAWHKNLTGTPSLPPEWVEANGQTIVDADSPYNGQTIPDLNGSGLFIRGNSTSGVQQDATSIPNTTVGASSIVVHNSDGADSYSFGSNAWGQGGDTRHVTFSKVRPDNISMVYVMKIKSSSSAPTGNGVPFGTVIAWHKNLIGTPSLPSEWVEANGQTISDPDSPFNGQAVPDLNGSGLFIRGSLTSGVQQDATSIPNTTVGASSIVVHNSDGADPYSFGSNAWGQGGDSRHVTFSKVRPDNMSMVYIMKIKATPESQ